MRLRKKLLMTLALPLLLTSCGANEFAGKSFSYESATATYSGEYTEDTFFAGFTSIYANLADFGQKAGVFYSSTKKGERTYNECLNFTSESGLTNVTYKGKAISAYIVNHQRVSEYEVTDRCSYFVENGNAKFINYSTETGEYVDYSSGGFQMHDNKTYKYSYTDTSIKIVDNKLVMHLDLSLKLFVDGEETSSRNADVTLNWAKK